MCGDKTKNTMKTQRAWISCWPEKGDRKGLEAVRQESFASLMDWEGPGGPQGRGCAGSWRTLGREGDTA